MAALNGITFSHSIEFKVKQVPGKKIRISLCRSRTLSYRINSNVPFGQSQLNACRTKCLYTILLKIVRQFFAPFFTIKRKNVKMLLLLRQSCFQLNAKVPFCALGYLLPGGGGVRKLAWMDCSYHVNYSKPTAWKERSIGGEHNWLREAAHFRAHTTKVAFFRHASLIANRNGRKEICCLNVCPLWRDSHRTGIA